MLVRYSLIFEVKASDDKLPTFDQILESTPIMLAKLESLLASSDPEILFVGLRIDDWRG